MVFNHFFRLIKLIFWEKTKQNNLNVGREIVLMVKNSFYRYMDGFFRDMTSLGASYMIGGIGLVFLVFGQFDNFLKIIFIVFSSYLISAFVRMFYFKNRPKKEEYVDFLGRIDASSFPSVHTARTVSTALLLNSLYSELLPLIVIVGVIVLYSRIYLKKHDWVDLLGGVILGGLVFWLMGMIM